MAGYKETPRQKMIGMMYLVLTALLALNVSKDILQAFVTVNDGLEKTNKNFEGKNALLYTDFAQRLAGNAEKVRPYYDKAMVAKEKSDKMVKYIKDLMTDVVAATEAGVTFKPDYSHRSQQAWKDYMEFDLQEVKKKDSYDKAINILIPNQANVEKEGEAAKLKNKLWAFEKEMIALLAAEQQEGVDLGFDYAPAKNKELGGKEMPWEYNTFYHTVLAADVVLFNKMIAEVRNAEAEIVAKLISGISRNDFKFTDVRARIVPQSMMVTKGDAYKAQVFVAAYDATTKVKGVYNGNEIEGDSGVISINIPAGATGDHEIKGEIYLENPQNGELVAYPFETAYSVFAPSATVSATKVNVFYRGLENPLSVSVPGVSSANVRVTISGGHTITGSGGNYIVKPGAGKTAKVNVTATINGKSMSMGSFDYRIKNVPAPSPRLAGLQTGTGSKRRIVQAPIVSAELPDFLFEGVKFRVTSFTFVIRMPNGDVKTIAHRGNQLNAQAKGLVQKAKRGQRVFIEDIRAKMLGGTGQAKSYKLDAVIIKLN